MTVVALDLPSTRLDREEADVLRRLEAQLERFRVRNDLKAKYYDGRRRLRSLGISIPPTLASIDTVVGWPAIAVDVLEERLDLRGWADPQADPDDDELDLGDLFRSNDLDVEAGFGHTDALIFGTSFVAVSTGADDEPDPLITVESPMEMTGEWDRRSRRLTSAALFRWNDDGSRVVGATLWLPGVRLQVAKTSAGWYLETGGRTATDFGSRLPIVRLINRGRGSARGGKSEITRAIRSLTDQGVRTLVRAEVNAEFFSAPQRYALNVDESAFLDKDGRPKPGWEAYMGQVWAMQGDADNPEAKPTVGQFPASSMTPHFEQLRVLAQLLGAEGGFPAAYLGFASDNPPSADAIRAGEARLIKRAERRQTGFGLGWREVARLALIQRDGGVDEERFAQIRANWVDAATPTRSAASDEATKLISSGVLLADSSVTYDRVGLSATEQAQLDADKRRARVSELFPGGAPAAVDAARTDPNVVALADRRSGAVVENPAELKQKADALGALIRAGVEASSAAAQVGLTGLQFTGAVPVSLRLPESDAAALEQT